ncbi:hypothetical protein KC686_02160 [Candidatus Woesebacteria bacterium]|nr:hypothetical protein [Candidatus Woesebacteria bacterium]
MATVVNNPPADRSDGNGMGFLLGMIVLVVVLALFFFYGLPMLRQTSAPSAPSEVQVEVPDQINIDVEPAE